VQMANDQGQTAQCKAVGLGLGALIALDMEHDCIATYQKQGFHQLPEGATPAVASSTDPSKQVSQLLPPPMPQNQIDSLRARITKCWVPPPGINANSKETVILLVSFNSDGTLSRAPAVVNPVGDLTGPQAAMAESAKKAVLDCQPFKMLKPENYNTWKVMQFKFDPSELLRLPGRGPQPLAKT
jgi:hypothetical protein